MADFNTQLIEAIFTLSRLMKGDFSYDGDLATLSMLQIQTLVFLKKNPNSQMTQIADKFAIELPSATSLVTKLIKAKLVSRSSDPKDRRKVHVNLTEKGSLLLANAMKQRSKKMEENLSYLSETEKRDLLRVTQTLIKRMEQRHEK